MEHGEAFDAWALPAGLAPPAGGGSSFTVGGVQVRYPGADSPWIERLVEALREGRPTLRARSAMDIAEALGRTGARFLDPEDPLRARALELLPSTSGLSREMSTAVLDGIASDWTAERLGALLDAELGDARALDGFVAGAPAAGRVRVRAVGPGLCVQIVAGSVPGVTATALLRSLLVKGPTLVKPGRGDVVLPVLLLQALREEDPALADAAAVVYWPGGSEGVENAALRAADVVTAYGADEVVGSLRSRTPVTARFVAYHHRVSVGVVGRDVLDDGHLHRAAFSVAGAVAFFDQRGCVSPQAVYVEEGGAATPARFAEELAVALAEVEKRLPGGELEAAEASLVHQERGTAELLAASGSGVEVRHGGESSWTVIYDPTQTVAPWCVGRVVRVKPVADIMQVPGLLAPLAPHLQTVGVAGCVSGREALAESLASVGVSRVAAFDVVPFPPPTWHHDGQGPLRALVRWTDLEDGEA